jgi:hypothetical protein
MYYKLNTKLPLILSILFVCAFLFFHSLMMDRIENISLENATLKSKLRNTVPQPSESEYADAYHKLFANFTEMEKKYEVTKKFYDENIHFTMVEKVLRIVTRLLGCCIALTILTLILSYEKIGNKKLL